MKNHKGFTLVEILAVIIVLALLSAIMVPIVGKLLKSNEEALSQNQIDNIITIAKKYAVEHSEILPAEDSGDIVELNLDTLIAEGYIDKSSIINPSSKQAIDGYVNIYYDINYNQYQYEFMMDDYVLEKGTEYTFPYVSLGENKEQSLSILKTGYYKLEVWGASGGNANSSNVGGYGGYSSGIVKLTRGNILYINVGGAGGTTSALNASVAGGYNGGGGSANTTSACSSYLTGSGGGATHIALKSGVLSSLENDVDKVLIVAGGGGGSAFCNNPNHGSGGHGGGFIAGEAYNLGSDAVSNNGHGTGGTQNSGGYTYRSSGNTRYASFGQGYDSVSSSSIGGGGGYYGGGAGSLGSGGGGSSYIGNSALYNGVMYCYGCMEYGTGVFKTISTTGSNRDSVNCPNNYSTDALSNCAKSGNGYAKVTYLGRNIENNNNADDSIYYEFANIDDDFYHMFKASKTGYYKFEAWGAQGQNSSENQPGGKGGYTSGVLHLNVDNILYVYVGGRNGYNGGGTKGNGGNGGGGGGATDIRILPKSNANSLASRIMVAGGGGGAYNWAGAVYNHPGGAAGGLSGANGTYYNTCQSTGGTQIAGGTCSSSSSVSGSFGIGGNGYSSGAGGGGGYYGGAGRYDNPGSGSGAGGGSSYVSGYTGCVAIASETSITARSAHNVLCQPGTTDPECSHHYSGNVFTSPVIIDGASSMPSKNGGSNVTGNSGDGMVKITYLGESLN